MLKTLIGPACLLFAALQTNESSLPKMRMTPAEVRATATDNNQAGGSGVAGQHRKILFGDPAKAGLYSILLFVPPHTTIQAHSHRDDRMATVVSGEWHFAYGERFDASALKTLPPGSVYSEPGGAGHYAQTNDDPVILHIVGDGPSDTHYFDSANDPALQKK